MKLRTLTILSLMLFGPCAALASSGSAGGEGIHPWLRDDFLLSAGTFLQHKDIELAVRGAVGAPTQYIDVDETFGGGEEETVFAFSFHWRFKEKWWLSTEVYSTRFREGNVLETDVKWGDLVFPIGSYTTGGFSTDLYRVVAGRQVHRDEKSELGLGLGIHWLEIGASIEGEARIGDDVVAFRREAVEASAPLPNIGFWYLRGLSPKWAGVARWDWFAASVQEYSGSLTNLQLGVVYQVTPHLGLSFSYKRFALDADVDKRGWYGKVEYTQKGPFLGLSGNW